MLFLTENYAALRILQQDLLFNTENPPFVLFGSSFPKDMEYTQVCMVYVIFCSYCVLFLQPLNSIFCLMFLPVSRSYPKVAAIKTDGSCLVVVLSDIGMVYLLYIKLSSKYHNINVKKP